MSGFRRFVRLAGVFCTVVASLWLALRLWAVLDVRASLPRFESRWGEVSLEALSREVPRADENAAIAYRAAGMLLQYDARLGELRIALQVPASEVSGETRATIRDLAERNRLALDVYRTASARKRCEFVPEPPFPGFDLDYLMTMLQVSRLDLLLARDGPAAEVEAAYSRALALGRCLQNERLQIHRRIGQAVERTLLREVRFRIAASGYEPALSGMASALPNESDFPSLAESMRFELLILRPPLGTGAALGLPSDGPFWHPFVVRGFAWAVALRSTDFAIARVQGSAQVRPHWSPLRPFADFGAEAIAPLWEEMRARRERQKALRELARMALLVAERIGQGQPAEDALRVVRALPEVDAAIASQVEVGSAPPGVPTLSVPDGARPTLELQEGTPRDQGSDEDAWTWPLRGPGLS